MNITGKFQKLVEKLVFPTGMNITEFAYEDSVLIQALFPLFPDQLTVL